MRHYSNETLLQFSKNFDEDENYLVFDPSLLGLKLVQEDTNIISGSKLLDRLDSFCEWVGEDYVPPVALLNGDIEDHDGMILATKIDILESFNKTEQYSAKRKG